MKQQGKVRWIGMSATHPHLETYVRWGVFDCFQIPYRPLERAHEELIQAASDSGAASLCVAASRAANPAPAWG